MGIRCADHVTPLYPKKLALTSQTGGGRSVGIVRSRTKATVFFKLQFYFDVLLQGAHPCSRAAALCLFEIGLCYRHFRRPTLTQKKNSFQLRSRGFPLASVELGFCSFRHILTWQKYSKFYKTNRRVTCRQNLPLLKGAIPS